MINHYRTLLLNLTDVGNTNEYIAPKFTSLVLPPPLVAFYNLLFPAGISRFYAEFLAFTYLQILRAADQQHFVYSLDNRLTYDLDTISDYFIVQQLSNPLTSNANYPIFLFGQYNASSNISKNYDDIVVSQVTGIYLSIYSKSNNVYYNETGSSPNLTSNFIIKASSNLANITTDVIPIANTGLSFSIGGNLIDLSDASGLNWEFIAQAPFNFDFSLLFNNLLTNLPIVNGMLNYNTTINDPSSYNLWTMHYNPVYRFAGLLNCYILQLNNLLN
jgi:hypothetical protein